MYLIALFIVYVTPIILIIMSIYRVFVIILYIFISKEQIADVLSIWEMLNFTTQLIQTDIAMTTIGGCKQHNK